jgi:hypothetical protein
VEQTREEVLFGELPGKERIAAENEMACARLDEDILPSVTHRHGRRGNKPAQVEAIQRCLDLFGGQWAEPGRDVN